MYFALFTGGRSGCFDSYTYERARIGIIGGNGDGSNLSAAAWSDHVNTGNTGGAETRPDNTTIEVWIRRS